MGALSIVEKVKIQEQVQQLLDDWCYNEDVDNYVDIIKFAESQGFIVGTVELPDSEDGFLLIDPKGSAITKSSLGASGKRKVIGVNRERPLDYKRFIIAHEFAHSVLHWDESKQKNIYLHRENRKGKNEQENDADFFAACLLMPQRSFWREYQKLLREGAYQQTDICYKLAELFRVPFESVSRRIDEVTIALKNSHLNPTGQ